MDAEPEQGDGREGAERDSAGGTETDQEEIQEMEEGEENPVRRLVSVSGTNSTESGEKAPHEGKTSAV